MILSEHHVRAIRHKIRAAGHLIAAEYDCELSDVLDIAVTAPFTPSQPSPPPSAADTPATHAPGVQTDGGERQSSSLPSSPSVDLSGLAAHEQGPTELPAPGNAPEPESRSTISRPSGSGDLLPKAPTLRDRIVAAHREHPDWPAKLLAEYCGTREEQVRNAAQKRNLKLPTWWEYQRAQQAKTTEALKASPAKPQEAAEPPPAPEAPPEREQPPAVKSASPRPVTAPNEPRRIVPTHAPIGAGPSTRFYVRDIKGRYLHQSLERSPTDSGPLMTSNRKWAWFDNAQRFAGACRKWPEIADMRKELPNA